MITVVIGTNRPESKTKLVARHLGTIYANLGETVKVLDLAHLPYDLFLPSAYARKPAAFQEFVDAILYASGVVLVTPEYNGGMPGVLKYFIDMLPFPESFERRAVCFVGLAAGRWGALRPVEHLQQILGYRNAFIYPERVFIPEVYKVVDGQGVVTDPELVKRLEAQAAGFSDFVKKLTTSMTIESEH